MAKRYTRNKRRRKTRKMRGGVDLNDSIPHSEDDSHYLDIDQSFQSEGSLHPSDLDVSDRGYTTEQSIVPGDFGDLDSIPQDESNIMDMDQSLHLSDLNTTEADNSGYTTGADDDESLMDMSFGGKKRRKRSSTKKRRGKKTRKNRRKQKGGICYGNGVGANSYDPNYSIYNTNMLKLFPYKP